METFTIEIEETVCRVIKIKAECIESALIKIEGKYKTGEIVLDENDFLDYTIRQI